MFKKRSISRLYPILFNHLFILALTFGALDVTPAHAAGECYVKWNASGTNSGTSWTNAYTDLKSALGASPCTEIWAAAGTYTPGTLRTDTFQLKNGVALYGGFIGTEEARTQRNPAANITILSGEIGTASNSDNSYHVVTGVTGATLDGFTITAGNANDGAKPNSCGGGMYNPTSNPTLMNVIFSGNSASNCGGGMYNYTSNPTLMNVTFSGNSAGQEGGGMYNDTSHLISLTNVTFNNNSAIDGGGMYNFTSNHPLTNVTFNNNSAIDGGGMYNFTSSTHLINVTFSDNSAVSEGGGMYNDTSAPNLWNVTFSGNSAVSEGGGMYNVTSAPIIYNTIFWGNTAPSGAQIFNFTAGVPIVRDSVVEGGCPTGGTCTNINPADPILGTLGNYGGFTQTIPLMVGSSAIDALLPGTNGCGTTIAATDQRGMIRSQGSGCDIGAFEQDDFTAPSVTSFTLKTPATSPTNADTLTFLATFSEPVTHVDLADFVKNSTSTATVTAVFQVTTSTYDVTISGGDLASFNDDVDLNLSATPTMTDLGGNALPVSEPSIDQTYVIDTTAPTITITEPDTSAALNKTITASAPGGALTMSNTTGTTCDSSLAFVAYSSQTFSSESDNGTKVCYKAVDTLGNTAYNLSNAIAGIDTTAPTVTIDTHPANPTNSTSAAFTFTPSGSPTSVDCKLDDGSFATCTTTGSQSYAGPLGEGSHTFTVRVTDAATNSSTATYTWVIDTTAPTVTMTSLASDPTNASPIAVRVTFSESVTGFRSADIVPANGAVSNFAGSGASYTFDLTPGVQGLVTADIAAGVATDLAGNGNTIATQFSRVYDVISPIVSSSLLANPSPTNLASVNFTVTFSEFVMGVGVTDFSLTTTGVSGAYVTGVSGSGIVYTVTVNTGSGNGTIRLEVPVSATIADLVGNPLAGRPYTGGETYTITKVFTIFLPLILH